MIPNCHKKLHKKTLEQLRRSCAYKVLTCKTLKLDYLPLESSDSNYILSCTSTYNTKLSYEISLNILSSSEGVGLRGFNM